MGRHPQAHRTVQQCHPLRLAPLKHRARDPQRIAHPACGERDGRPSIPPERLLRALLLQAFYMVRSERQLMEQLDFNLLFRWFVGLSIDDPVWDATVFCKNRDRLIEGDIARKFLPPRSGSLGCARSFRATTSRSTGP